MEQQLKATSSLSSSLSSKKEDYSGAEDNISQPMFEEAEEYVANDDSEPAGKLSFIMLQNLRSFTFINFHCHFIDYLTEYWCENDEEIEQDLDLSPSSKFPPFVPESQARDHITDKQLVWWIVAFVSIFQTFLHAISDTAIEWLLKFIGVLLHFLAQRTQKLEEAARRSQILYIIEINLLGEVMVLKCDSTWYVPLVTNSIVTQIALKNVDLNLTLLYVIHSIPCNAILLKGVVSIVGNHKLYPIKLYCYNSVISTLRYFFLRPDFYDLIEQTRNSYCMSTVISSLMYVYHSCIWREFLKVNQSEFLSATLCYGLMLNVDWFQPYNHFTYSIGVVYLVIMNLPRAYHYKRQNVIIVGIIPGPSEPPHSINSYLTPLVTELLQFWVGVQITLLNSDNKIIRAALLAVACDVPASRKVCGFLCHSANLGCNRCYCEFYEGWLQRDYSNFDQPSWCLRSNTKHRQDV